MPVEQSGDDARLDLALLAFVELLLVQFVAFLERLFGKLGEDRRHKRDIPAIGRPDRLSRFGGNRGELSCFAAVGCDQIKLESPAAIRFEHDPLSVRRPTRMPIMLWTGGQLSRFAPRQRHQPDVAVGLVLHFVRPGDDVSDRFAVRRDLRVTEALGPKEIVELQRASRVGGESTREASGSENAQECVTRHFAVIGRERFLKHANKEARNCSRCQASALLGSVLIWL